MSSIFRIARTVTRTITPLAKREEKTIAKSVTSLSTHNFRANTTPAMFFSDDASKNKNFNFKQNIVNAFSASITGKQYINTEKCDKIIILEKFRAFLEKENFVQIPSFCLQECSIIIDSYHGNRGSFMFTNSQAKGLTSLTSGQVRKIGDSNYESYLKQTQSLGKKVAIEQGVDMKRIGIKKYIEDYVGHKVLTTFYISAKELQKHFENNPEQPLYSFCEWGGAPDKQGYFTHTILIYGVNTKQEIHYYDVSDKLDTQKYSRFKVMDIEEFNDRRNSFQLTSDYWDPRAPIFYKGE